MPRTNRNLSYTLSDARRRKLDREIQRIGTNQVLNNTVDKMLGDARTTDYWSRDKNSYAFWGPVSANLVKTPDSMYIPISFDAFCVSGTKNEFNLKSAAAHNANAELIAAAEKIRQMHADAHRSQSR